MTAATNAKDDEDRPKRAFATHTPKWQRFQTTLMVPSEKAANVSKMATEVYAYHRQYSHVYDHRLTMLQPRCWEALEEKMVNDNDDITRVHRILELRESVRSMVVGTLIKETGDSKEEPLVEKHSKCRPSDALYLEDQSGRVALQVENVHKYCTGVVVGVIGTVDEKGTLHVEMIVPPIWTPPVPIEQDRTIAQTTDTTTTTAVEPHLMIVSSLQCGHPEVPSLPRDMLLSYLLGHFTLDARKVCRVIIAGGGPSSQDPLEGMGRNHNLLD